MTTGVRADAARNAERILRAAREVYAEVGPDAQMELVASRAGVGERTLYRRFPTKGDLIRAVLDQSIAENLAPAMEKALKNRNPLRGLTDLIEAAIALGAREHSILAAARKADALDNVSARLDEALYDLTRRAQEAGLVRADLVADDLPRIIAMLNSVLWTMDPGSDGSRRYVALMLDALTTPAPRKLPPAVALRRAPIPGSWPL
ncbi:TetR/AcrR family transcriptional regulator [Mycolicibacterium sp. Dal123E01]|uniref:TetR/AcrR family transcriptional regulator n=1 Tax=Mycolicibacterium sp. Dal123E01 TaxID=3457578 RepID=UPI00403E8645